MVNVKGKKFTLFQKIMLLGLFTLLIIMAYTTLMMFFNFNENIKEEMKAEEVIGISKHLKTQNIIESYYGINFKTGAENGLKLPQEVTGTVTNVKVLVDDEEVTCNIIKRSSINYDLSCFDVNKENFIIEQEINR